MTRLDKFINGQLSVWPMAEANFRSLKTAKTREFVLGGLHCFVQHNPERVRSTTAAGDAAAIAARPCFLCPENRPKEQIHTKFEGRDGHGYNIQVNPYPIFPSHLVIARDCHIPQEIWLNLPDMLDFARAYDEFTVFYNGPESGASAPDHLHFQAVPRHTMPLENAIDSFLDDPSSESLASIEDASLWRYEGFTTGIYALKATTSDSLAELFYRLLDCTGCRTEGSEPRFNLYAYFKGQEYRAFVVMRSKIRSHHFYSEGQDHLTISPGAIDMTGCFIAPFIEDFEKVTAEMLAEMLAEVSISKEEQDMIDFRLTRTERLIDVGIMSAGEISFEIISDGEGVQKVRWENGRISYKGMLYDELYFDSKPGRALFEEPSFILHGVTIGIDFHWQRKRTLKYAGGLKFIVEGDKVTAVNRIGIENYLLSVISSEMKSSASLELLKAHAVISRSWVMSNLGIHGIYDVCADDHCQRYQGLSMAAGMNVRKAIDETWGQVLTYKGELCDARYSKCCGGRTELFSTCWEDIDPEYLQSFEDSSGSGGKCFCDCEDTAILSQVLNDYDMETRDFFRWKVRYSRKELSEMVKRRTGTDFGEIQALEPLETGPSGRIKFLRIVGSSHTGVIGKELCIRRALSESHLKSSAFTVITEPDAFVLEGKGWGHGVGLCQIGAAVMADKGYTYRQILAHYYRGAEIK